MIVELLRCEKDLEERVIRALGENGGTTAREISLVLRIPMTRAKKALDKLKAAGLLKEV